MLKIKQLYERVFFFLPEIIHIVMDLKLHLPQGINRERKVKDFCSLCSDSCDSI